VILRKGSIFVLTKIAVSKQLWWRIMLDAKLLLLQKRNINDLFTQFLLIVFPLKWGTFLGLVLKMVSIFDFLK